VAPSTTGTQSQTANLTTQSVQAIEDPSRGRLMFASVSPVVTTSETATNGGASFSSSVIGTTPNYLAAEDYTLAAGSPITQADVTNRQARRADRPDRAQQPLLERPETRSAQTIQLGSAQLRDHRRAR